MSIPFSKHSSDISVIDISYNNSHLVAVIILLSDAIEYIVKVIFTALCMSHAFTSKVEQSKLAFYRN